MTTTLLRRCWSTCLLLALLLSGARPAQATHLLGGEMSYRFLDNNGPSGTPFRYEVTVSLYSNGLFPNTPGITGPPANATVGIYNRTTNDNIGFYTVARQNLNLGNPISPHVPVGCAVQGPSQPFYLCKYVQTINLPVSFDGYYAVFSVSARNNDIDNINNSGNQPLTLYVSMAPPLIYNRSPVFSDTAIAVVCQNDTTITLNNAVDPDGDRLVYSFGTPYGSFQTARPQPYNNFPVSFLPLPNPVPYRAGFSVTNPFGGGAGNFALINASTGVARYGGTTQGKYVVAVDVSEYRTINGREVLIGTTRRDLQLVVSSCPPTPPPVLPPVVTIPRSYTIEEGQALTIPISASQSTGGHPLVMTVNSVLLDGSGPFNATFNGSQGTVQPGNLTGTATATGNGSVSGNFIFNSVCGNARTTPYDIGVTVQDNGCGGKLAADIFRVTVTRAAAPTGINGPTTVCDRATLRTYSAAGPVPASYRWRVTGGTIVSGQGTNTIGVTFAGTATTGMVVVKGISSRGCLTDSVSQTVDIRPLAALSVSATAPTICLGTSTTLAVSGAAGLTYSWTGGGQNYTGATITVSPTTTTTYTVTGTDGTCTVTATQTVTVTPPPVANAGPDRSTCPNVASTPLGVPAVAGLTYRWGPALGLSSTSTAQPTVTLPNTTGVPIVLNYGLTVSSAPGCQSTDSVRVTINPAAAANAGPARTVCPGVVSLPLGTPALPGYTYSWSPATGLSSATDAQPTVTLPNTTGAPLTVTYIVTATTDAGCTATSSATVTVNPAAVATPGPALSFCSGTVSAPLGGSAAPQPGYTYSWSPTTGLSDPNILHPTVTGINLTGAPIVRTYTLTVTTAAGCVGTATVDVTINPAAVAQAGPDKATCSNVGVSIGTGTAVAGTTYAWSPATGLSSAAVLNPTVTLPNLTNATLTQQYILLATTANGCFARDTVVVTVYPAAVPVPGTNQAVCSGLSVTLGAPAVPGYTYSWSPGTGLSSTTAANPTFSQTNTTNAPVLYTFTLTATTANGCVNTGTVTVTVNPAAVADAGPDAALCDLKTLTLGTPALPGYTYSWSPATGLSSATTAQPVFTASNPTAAPLVRTYTLTATTANGCVSTDAVVITINPRPSAEAIAGPTSVCPTVTGIAYSVPNPAASVYQWSVVGGTVASGNGTPSITVDWGTANPNGAVKVSRLNAQGCSSDTTVLAVIINQRLQTVRPTGPGDVLAVAPLPRAVCQADGPYTYTSGTFANGSSFSWTILGGTQVASSRNTVTVAWDPVTVPTIGKIVAIETSNPAGGVCRGVSDTLRVLINPSPRPNLSITAPARVCQGSGPVTFGLPGGFAGSSYLFQLSGTTLAGSGSTRTLSTLPVPGTYTLTVQETTAAPGSCVGPVYSAQFVVAPLPTAPVISGSAFVCDLTTSQQYAITNPTPGASYQWTITGGAVTAGGSSSQVTVRFSGSGPYAVSAVEISASPNLCAGPATTRAITFDNPALLLANASVDATSNARIIITLSAPNSANTPNQVRILRRVAGAGTFSSVGTVAPSASTFADNNAVDANANSYEYKLELNNGCGTLVSSSTAQTVRLVATPAAGAGGRDQGSVALSWNAYVGFAVKEYRIYRQIENGTPTLLTTLSPSTTSYSVSNTDLSTGVATGFGLNQRFRVVAASTDATALLSNSNEASVSFTGALNVYNVITPNGDTKNDVLVIDNVQLYPGNTLTIFNRWGREVYKTTNYRNDWGMDPGIAPGNYFYLLTVPNGPSVKTWFEVIK